MTLLYDADCGFCTASAGWLGRRSLRTAISPLHRADLAALGVDADRARREIPFVEAGESGTRVSYGHIAIGRALSTGGPGWRLAGWLLLRRRNRAGQVATDATAESLGDWVDACCPVCLAIGATQRRRTADSTG